MVTQPKNRDPLVAHPEAVGFTGTQNGLTEPQVFRLTHLMKYLRDDESYEHLHHGDCVGSDEQAAYLWRGLGGSLTVHPPLNPSKRAYCGKPGDIILPGKDYLVRNHNIVHETSRMIVTPRGMTSELRSGTWATFRFAFSLGRPIHVVYPDGTVENYNV